MQPIECLPRSILTDFGSHYPRLAFFLTLRDLKHATQLGSCCVVYKATLAQWVGVTTEPARSCGSRAPPASAVQGRRRDSHTVFKPLLSRHPREITTARDS